MWADKFARILPKGARILDVGCAGGRDSQKFFKLGFEVTGIDVIDLFVSEAQKFTPKAKFYKMDLRELKFPANYFDAIWANAVLLHFPKTDILSILKKLKKVLKKGGKMHIAVKYGRGEKWVADKLSEGQKRFFSYFAKKELENYIKSAGFKVVFSQIDKDCAGREELKWVVVWAQKI